HYTLQRMMQVEIMNEEISQMEVVEDKIMQESSIMQKEIAELSCKRSSYTKMSRTTTWRKKQKVDTSLGMKASSNLSHLFPAVNIMKWLQLSQSPLSMLIGRYIKLLLDGQEKMNASIHLAQTIWCKGDNTAKCIRK
ncbi:4696_t:CDS:2, partial [Cetraspora pellucida]